MKRQLELDFLRGWAILLVLMRHQYLFDFTERMGWIGVDLFFVLSGFLVSGLLFREYLKYNTIRPGRFLIRRGFKIYPIYYLFYLAYLSLMIWDHKFQWIGFFGEMVFFQNYISGFGWAFGVGWSLAIEEHFYFGFSLLLYLGLQKNWIRLKLKQGSGISKGISLEILCVAIMILCLVLRLVSNKLFPGQVARNFTMTHLRIDSLIAGVLISYWFHFYKDALTRNFHRFRYGWWMLALAGLSWTPFYEPMNVTLVRTVGFSLLYISFGIILIAFLVTPDMDKRLLRLFSAPITKAISKIGFCSYSIYIIHLFVDIIYNKIAIRFTEYPNVYIRFALTTLGSVGIGLWMTLYVEQYFLRIRDRVFPSRV